MAQFGWTGTTMPALASWIRAAALWRYGSGAARTVYNAFHAGGIL